MAKHKQSTFERLRNGKLPCNRKQRRELERRLNSADPGLEIIHPHAAGIDVGNESHYVAVPPGRDARPVREFGSWTAALEEMAQWLKSCGVESVVMQSTGVYWIAVHDVLERHGLEVNLVDARGTKSVPGRKSDVQECQWLLKLHTYGLLRSCFLPAPEIHGVRTVWRLRDQHVKDAGRCIQHMQKALIEMNLQLHKFYQKQMAACDTRLQSYMAALPTREALSTPAASSQPAAATQADKKRRPRKPKGNQPAFDLAAELQRILGVDATRIDGIEVMTIQTVLAEVGPDLRAWKSEDQWSSWLNLAPKRDISGGRVIRHRREYRTNRAGNAFRMAAESLVRSQSYLGARYRYLRAKLGGLKAVKAMARVLACVYYRLITKGQVWVDRGTAAFEQRRQQRDLATLQRKARSLGMQLVPAA